MTRFPMLLALALTACATAPAPDAPLTGSWGSQQAALTLDERGGSLEYGCAAGTIAGPLVPDAEGRFTATGTHTPGLGGPARIDYTPPASPARYSGTVRGSVLHLRVDVPALDLVLGPFDLRRGAEAMLVRCL